MSLLTPILSLVFFLCILYYSRRTSFSMPIWSLWTRLSISLLCSHETPYMARPRGMGWGGWWEGGLRWGTHVSPWLIHVWQKPLQYCKVISLWLIKINEKKKRNPLQILLKIKHYNNFFTYLTKSLTRLCIFEKPLVFQVFIARQYMAYSLCLQKEEHIRLTHCTLPTLMPVELFRSGQGRAACGPH